MRSFQLVPVTNLHPSGLLTPDTAKDHAVGAIGESVRQDGDHLAATMMIHDAVAMQSISDGRSKLSCGYTCEMDDTPGVWKGQAYDAIQRNIVGNHLALVDVARAGSFGDLAFVPFATAFMVVVAWLSLTRDRGATSRMGMIQIALSAGALSIVHQILRDPVAVSAFDAVRLLPPGPAAWTRLPDLTLVVASRLPARLSPSRQIRPD